MTGAWAIMCCGCRRVMSEDGEPIDRTDEAPIATFPTKPEADAFAGEHHWKAEDGNHRCPDCVAEEELKPWSKAAYPPTLSGAYLWVEK